MQVLIEEIKSLNEEVLKENTQLSYLLEKQIRYNRNLERKKTLQNINQQNISNEFLVVESEKFLKRENTEIKEISKSKVSTTKNETFLKQKKDTFLSNNKNSSFSKSSSHLCHEQKSSHRCPSCKSLNKSRKSSSNETAITHSKIITSKHESNMMKLEKLSQKILPKVSKHWLYKKKAKVFHFE